MIAYFLILTSLAWAEIPAGSVRYAARDVPTIRFADATVPGPMLGTGEILIVILDDGALVRVKKGDSYGWVVADALVEEPPTPPMPDFPMPDFPLPPQLGQPAP